MHFDELKALSEIRYQQEQQALKHLLLREAELRAELGKLNDHDRDARAVPFSDATAPRSLGADILWMKWLEKSRSAINLELAKTLAQKDQHLARVRQAYGKLLVSETLSERHHANTGSRKKQRLLDEMIDREAVR